MAVGPKKVLELGHDGITDARLSIPGFAGLLGTNGRATASLPIPNFPWLTGLAVHAAMVSIDLSLPELVEETSPPPTFVIQ